MTKGFASAARTQARAAGHMKYVPETPCRHGHRLRYTKAGTCVECEAIRHQCRGGGAAPAPIIIITGIMRVAEEPDIMVAHTAETALLAFWKESAKVWRRRMHDQTETGQRWGRSPENAPASP